MQPLDALTLHHLAGELDLKLADGKVNKVQQASHHELLLHLFVGGEAGRQKLYINIRPEYAFCALMDQTAFQTFPEKAPNFCMVLRKHLTSARIKQVKALPDERVLNLHMDNYNELGQQVQLVLSLELMGKHSNIILYDEELRMILGCAHGVSEEMSRMREISVGYPYAPPPAPPKPPLRYAEQSTVVAAIISAQEIQQDPVDALISHYSGVGKATLRDIFEGYTDANRVYQALQELFQGVHLYPAVKRDMSRYSLLPTHQGENDWIPMGSLNGMVQRFYLTHLIQERLKTAKHQLSQVLKAQEKKLRKRLHEVERSDAAAIELLRQGGDLLTVASSQQLEHPGNRITLADFNTGVPVTLELDPSLTLSENAQLYYRRYKKAQARQTMATQISGQLENQCRFLAELSSAIQLAESLEELASVREDMEQQGWLKPTEARSKKGGPKKQSAPLSLTSSDGFTLLVGKNGIQNEQIAGKLSRPDDIWLHAHLIPGSHVLIKADRQDVPDETLFEAAVLAAYFSKARDSINVPVIYTRAQYIRKIPESYPGHVNYTHEKAVNVTPEPALIAKLLGPH